MRSKTTAALLAFFLGGFGAHHFYLGQIGRGFIYLGMLIITIIFAVIGVGVLVGAILGLLCLADFIYLLVMDYNKFNIKFNPTNDQP